MEINKKLNKMRYMSEEEIYDEYLKVIRLYLEKETFTEFDKFVDFNEYNVSKNPLVALKYINENFSKKMYDDFYAKIYPFEPNSEGTDKEEKEELKKEVSKLAYLIGGNQATLIDIVENLTPDLNLYMYMVKQLRYKYKLVGATTYTNNSNFYHYAYAYHKDTVGFSLAFPGLTKEDDRKLKEIVSRNNLPLNDITYNEAYRYAKNHQIIKTNNIR
jgi:hypothetical protein